MMPVLIVEDDPSTAELERRCLARAGLAARVCERAEEAVALLKEGRFSAVLLDYALPEGDPWTVLEAAQLAIPRVPVIIVTGKGNEKVAAEAIHRGVQDYITKTNDYFDRLPDIVQRSVKLAQTETLLALLASIVNSSEEAIISHTLEGVILTWNAGAEKIFGYSETEMLGKNVSLLLPADRAAELSGLPEKIKRGESIRQYETVRLRKDGPAVAVSLTLSPIKDAQRRIIGASAITRDISEQKRTESLLLATLESTADGILVVDTQRKITRYNRRFLEMWRMPASLAALRDDEQALAYVLGQLQDPQGFLAKVRELYADARAKSYDVILFKDGRVFERFSEPQLVGTACMGRVWSFHDITDLKRAEDALKAKVEELEHLNEIMMGREERILELKEEVKALKSRLELKPPEHPAGEGGQWAH